MATALLGATGKNLPWLLLVIIGAALRLYAIEEQVIIDDEYHALTVALGYSYGHIATHFFGADNSIPLTLLYKVMADTVGVSEWGLRAPQLISGLLLLAVFAWLARRLLPPREALLYATLLALSPQLAFFSRYARPYGVSAFCAGLALAAFVHFLRTGRFRPASLYWAGGVLAIYFHPLAFPFVLGPPGFVVLTLLLRRTHEWKARLRGVIVVTTAVVLMVAALFAAPALNSVAALTGKAGTALYSWNTFRLALRLMAGVTSGWAAAGMLILAALGVRVLLRRDCWLAGCLLFCVVCQFGAVLTLSPYLAHHFYVFARYDIWTLPVLLLFVAAGTNPISLGKWPGFGAVLLLLLLVVWFSPHWDTYRMPNNFTNHSRFQIEFTHDGNARHRDATVAELGSPAYTWLRAQPAGTIVAEVPWYHMSSGIIYGDLQRRHGKRVRVAILDQRNWGWLPMQDKRLRLRTFVAADPASLRERGVAYLIVHKHLIREVTHLHRELPEVPPYTLAPADMEWRSAFGQPVYDDDWVRVYAVNGRVTNGSG